MAPTDKRKIVGELVYVKAKHVTRGAECSRLFGAHANQKDLIGKIIEIDQVPRTSNRSSTYITVDYVLPNGKIKRKKKDEFTVSFEVSK